MLKNRYGGFMLSMQGWCNDTSALLCLYAFFDEVFLMLSFVSI
jgi:hypothetical protein